MMTTMTGSEMAPPHEDNTPPRQPNLQSNNPYEVLAVPQGADTRQVKRAYFELVREYTPENDPDAFKKIRAAYEKLRTDKVKMETDLFAFQSPPAWEHRKRFRKVQLEVDFAFAVGVLRLQTDLGKQDFSADYRPIKV